MYILSLSSNLRKPSACSVSPEMFLALSYGDKGTVMPAEQYSSVFTQAPPKLGWLEKTCEKIENHRLRNADIAIFAAVISGNGRRKAPAKHIGNKSTNSELTAC